MKYRLMDILACPECRNFPLKLIVLEREEYDRRLELKKPFCELYCSFLDKNVRDVGDKAPCDKCIRYEIVTGVIYCTKCGRWYPIINTIPRMLPDKHRKRKEDIAFLEKYKDKLPREIVYEGKPFNLSE